MSTDIEWEIRQAAKALADYYFGLDYLIHDTTAPRGERIMKSRPGPRMPGNWLWMSRKIEMEQRLREIAFNAFKDIGVKLKDGEAKPRRLLEKIAFHAQPISELGWASDFLDELDEQLRWLGKWMTPRELAQVANADPYLTADSIDRSLASKGLACPPATVRSWAQRGHVATKQRRDGRTAYRLADIIARLTSEK